MTIPPRRVPLPSDYLKNRMSDQAEPFDASLEPHTVPLNDGMREATVYVCEECGRKIERPLKCQHCEREELAEGSQPRDDPFMEGGE